MPMTTDLPVGDLFEFIGDFRLNGDGPPTTGRMGLARLQEILLSSTSPVGALLANITTRLTTAEGFTNQIAGLSTRVATLEALGGISPGTDLAADGTAVRSTRYWPRPGEAIRTWTAEFAKTALTAAPLTVGGIYSITTDGPGKGPALRITGTGYATSIAKTHLDDGEIVEFTFRLARRIDNTGTNAAANNVPVLEFRCYKADGTDNGTVALSTTTLLAADGLRTVTYRACLTPGVGSVDLAANTRFISPLFGERGTGAVELTSADRSTQSLTSAPEMTDAIAPEDRLFILDDSAKLIKKLSPLMLAQYVESFVAEKFYNRTAYASAGPDAAVILPADPARNSIDIMNPSSTTTILISYDGPPALGQIGTRPLAPGEGYYREHGPTGPLWVKSLGDTVPLVFDYTNSSNLDVLKYFLADQYIAKSNFVPSAAQREIFTTFFNTIKPLLPLLGGAAILGGPQSALALQDIVRNYTWRRLGTAATFEQYKGFRGDGSTSYIGTGYIPETDTSRFLLNSHGFGGVFSGEIQTTTVSAMGSYRQGLAPQRGSRGVAGVRSSFQSNDVVNIDYIGDGGEGGFFGVFRNSPDRYELTHRKAVYSVPTPSSTTGAGGNQEMVILAQMNSANAALGFSTLQCRFAFFGAYLTVEQRALLLDAEAAMNASFLALGA